MLKAEEKPNGSYYTKCEKCEKLIHARQKKCNFCIDPERPKPMEIYSEIQREKSMKEPFKNWTDD